MIDQCPLRISRTGMDPSSDQSWHSIGEAQLATIVGTTLNRILLRLPTNTVPVAALAVPLADLD